MTLLRHVGFFHFKNALFDLGNAQLLVSEFFRLFQILQFINKQRKTWPNQVFGTVVVSHRRQSGRFRHQRTRVRISKNYLAFNYC